MNQAIDILCCIPNFNDSSSWWRGIHPFTRMKKHGHNVGIISAHPASVDYATCDHAHIFFGQRPASKTDLDAISKAKTCGLPVWLDFDDDYITIESSNPHYIHYKRPELQQVFLTSLSLADVVTASTVHLAERLMVYGAKKVVVVPNSIDPTLFNKDRELPRRVFPKDAKVCVWRGSNTHIEDLKIVESAFVELSQEYQDKGWTFAFLGYRPYFLIDKMKYPEKVFWHADHEVYRYLKLLPQLQTQVWWSSLKDCEFNKSKSNIAWQEAALSGSAIVCTDLPEWQHPGCITYKTQTEFYDRMKHLLDRQDHKQLGDVSWDTVKESYPLEKSSKIRWEIISEILDLTPHRPF